MSEKRNLQLVWSVLCKESMINADDNNVSLLGILEEVTLFISAQQLQGIVSQTYSVPFLYEIVSLWQKTDAVTINAEIVYRFLDGQNNEVFSGSQHIEIPKTAKRFRSRIKFTGIVVKHPGDYHFDVQIKELPTSSLQSVATIPLELKIIKEAAHQQKHIAN